MTRVGELKFYATEIVFRNTVNGSCPRANTMIGYGKVSSRIGLYWIADTRRQGHTVLLRSTLQFFLYKANTRLRCARDQIMESHLSKRLFICSCFGLPKQRKNTGVHAFRLRRENKKGSIFKNSNTTNTKSIVCFCAAIIDWKIPSWRRLTILLRTNLYCRTYFQSEKQKGQKLEPGWMRPQLSFTNSTPQMYAKSILTIFGRFIAGIHPISTALLLQSTLRWK